METVIATLMSNPTDPGDFLLFAYGCDQDEYAFDEHVYVSDPPRNVNQLLGDNQQCD